MAHVLVTGALGTLGRATTAQLIRDGHKVTTLDNRPAPDAWAAHHVVADIRDPQQYRTTLADCEALVHLASLHGRDHMARFGFDDFWSVNVDGTLALYRALKETAVSQVVLASSMAVYGPIPSAPRSAWEIRDESMSTTSYDAYSLTKLTSESIAEYTLADAGIPTTVLRFGHFTPAGLLHHGFRLLFGGLDIRDAAAAVAAALSRPPVETNRHLNIHAASPLPNRIDTLRDAPTAILEELFPQFMSALAERGEDPVAHLWGRSVWPIVHAANEIGYAPAYDFDRFTNDFLRGDLSDYRWLELPRWGI